MSNLSLYIGEKNTTIFQTNHSNNQLEIITMDKINTIEDFYTLNNEQLIEKQAEQINKLLESNKITNKNLDIIISDTFSYNQVLLMPALNEKELISSIKYQADQFIPMPIEETNIDLEIIEEYKNEKKLLILIVASAKKIIDKVQRTIEVAGFIPQLIETEVSSTSRFLFNYFSRIDSLLKNFITINFSKNTTTLCYYENNPPILKKIRNINFGYQLFVKELIINCDLDKEKTENLLLNYNLNNQSSLSLDKVFTPLINELVNEIRKFIGDQKLETIFFFNHIFYFPYLINLLEKNFNIPIKILNPEKLFIKNSLFMNKIKEIPLYISNFGSIIE